MRIPADPRLPADPKQLGLRLTDLFRSVITQLNGISEGLITTRHNAQSAAPTTGTHSAGDIVPNLSPSELGSAGSKYVITGWICTVSGTPGTWLQMRTLTGN